ncbi:MAG: chromate transporter [Sphaerochaetaceae bacterium]|nr:chromate transporter [Sphaerochaetaceae bacterium]MDC7237953.1 chromate transporter [Sphaerochaetaceae bacterium]MDC7249590.1 chromate transporter [Sphaerochaetaceae bacterium]
MTLFALFLCFLQIGAFSFGGGLAALPLIQQQVVTLNNWMSMSEFTDLIAIAEMTPGPIAVNSATFVGIHLFGIKGAIVATLGCILPSILFVAALGFLYNKYKKHYLLEGVLAGLRPAVVAMILSAGISIFLIAVFGTELNSFNIYAIIIFLCALYFMAIKKVNPILVLLLSGIIGGGFYIFMGLPI